ncbi:MAG: DUF4333 domain-containing protein [Thermoleophilaceae bacterium]
MKASAFAVLAAVLALGVAGCGSSTLDTAEIEDEVQELAEDRDLEVDGVTCPDDIEAEEGDEFDCEVEIEGGEEIDAEVTQRNDDGDVRIRIDAEQIAQGQQTDTGAGTDTDTGGGAQDNSQDAQLIEQAIRSFVTAARDGDAATFCGQQSDPRLARRYGSIEECVESAEAKTPVSSLPTGDQVDIEISSLTPPTATVQVSRQGGSGSSPYEMVDEGGQGGWAVESIDGE